MNAHPDEGNARYLQNGAPFGEKGARYRSSKGAIGRRAGRSCGRARSPARSTRSPARLAAPRRGGAGPRARTASQPGAATTLSHLSRNSVESQFTALVVGLQGLTDVDTWILGNKTVKKADVIAVFQQCVSAIAASDASHTSWQNALDREKAALAVARPLRSSVKSFLDGRLGKQNPDLQTFGFKPAKTPDKTVAAKATGIARTKATRAARHTMGSQQKKDIHGKVPPAAATPASPATAAPASATPAPSTATAPPVAPIKPSTGV